MAEQFKRPLSPHLQVYKPQLTSATSIFHRITGAALSLGTFLVIWILVAAATGPEAYGIAIGFSSSIFGQLLLFGWTVALYYHTFNGIRHLIWDTVHLLDLDSAYKAGYAVLALTAVFTILTWWVVL